VGPGAHARRIAGGWLIALAAALVILGGSIAPFLTPLYVRFEQDRADVESLTGFSPAVVDQVTAAILGDLVLWRDDFQVEAGGGPMVGEVLTASERSHMRDVRNVFTALWALVAVSILGLFAAFSQAHGPEARAAAWRAVRNGARWLTIVIAVAGAFALVAFDAAFEVFHRLFFSAGSYDFDPATSKLVQLFPERFWSETAIVVGAVIIIVSLVVAWQAGRRARALTAHAGLAA
jgi:integral membrane protein (TIGR01906 family)